MDARPGSKGKAGGRGDPFLKIEQRGGIVRAFRAGKGSLFELRHVGVRKGSAEILGHIPPEGVLFEDRPVPIDELKSLGWRYVEPGGWERRWVLRSDLDRTDLRRAVEATVVLLAALHDEDAGSYVLQYRPPGEEDAGSAEIGCLFAAVSAFVGDIVGLIVTVVRNEPFPLIEMIVFAGTIGFLAGFVGFGTAFPRLLSISPAFRGREEAITTDLELVVPGVVVLLIWLLAPSFGPLDGGLLLAIAGAVLFAVIVWGFIPLVGMLLGMLLGRGRRMRR